jgi:hypothetical protein
LVVVVVGAGTGVVGAVWASEVNTGVLWVDWVGEWPAQSAETGVAAISRASAVKQA